jgi:hypothetical protein
VRSTDERDFPARTILPERFSVLVDPEKQQHPPGEEVRRVSFCRSILGRR